MCNYARQEMAWLKNYDRRMYDDYIGSLDRTGRMANEIADCAIGHFDEPAMLEALAKIPEDEWRRYVTAVRYPGDREKLAALC